MDRFNAPGAIAANLAALCFIAGFSLYFLLLAPAAYPALDAPASSLRFMLAHRPLLYSWYLLIYLIFGCCLLVLVVLFHDKLRSTGYRAAQLAAAFGMIWAILVIASGMIATVSMPHLATIYAKSPAQAQTLWLAVQIMLDALGGGNEMAGGFWLLLINGISARSETLPQKLCAIGLTTGAAGVLTLIPEQEILAGLFGLGCILWFGGLSAVLLNQRESA